MPNHITNIIEIKDIGSATIEDVRASLLNDENCVDFKKIIPSPSCLEGFNPHHGILDAAKCALGLFEKPVQNPADIVQLTASLGLECAIRRITTPTKPEDIPLIIRAIQNYQECGYLYWYDWQTEHWGTMWNAYDQPEEGFSPGTNVFRFDTAWAHPSKIVMALSEKNPSVTFGVRFADEDIGSNCGAYFIKDGVKFDTNIAPGWNDMTDAQRKEYAALAFGIRYPGEDPAAYGYSKDWEYDEAIYDRYHENPELLNDQPN